MIRFRFHALALMGALLVLGGLAAPPARAREAAVTVVGPVINVTDAKTNLGLVAYVKDFGTFKAANYRVLNMRTGQPVSSFTLTSDGGDTFEVSGSSHGTASGKAYNVIVNAKSVAGCNASLSIDSGQGSVSITKDGKTLLDAVFSSTSVPPQAVGATF